MRGARAGPRERLSGSGVRADGGSPRDHWLAVALAQDAQLRDLALAQVLEPVPKIQHRVVEPLFLVLGAGFENAAAEDVGEQLVACLVKGRGGLRFAGFATFLGHAGRLLSWAGPRGNRRRNLTRPRSGGKPERAGAPSVYNHRVPMTDETYGPERA